MKKLTLIISIFLVAMTSCHSGKQFLDNAAPEERALNIMKVTDEEKTTVLMPEVRSGFPKNFATTRWSGNKNNGIHWGCNKLLSASPDGDEIAYMTAENKQTNIMIRRTTANGSATQRCSYVYAGFCMCVSKVTQTSLIQKANISIWRQAVR